MLGLGGLIILAVCGVLFAESGLPQAWALSFVPTETPAPTRTPTQTPTATRVPPTVTPVPPTATATATASPTATATPVIYIVQSGDVLGTIAAKYGVTVQAIMDANDIADPRLLRVGMRLVIPQTSQVSQTPKPSATR
ncbi:MAG: LysM peptidoglycan-binding domain-containing protein [Chloroflexi bacterium]|nr:LysM peptidoglycan-binding domain-containing protein [Chloroflexota bacterium]MBI3734198.1 LysM peptidoglycan-binding domain-containing protein [Chloroflexota bacterium]